ncbi:hypothetical protein [Leadbetterella sp. DM7]
MFPCILCIVSRIVPSASLLTSLA